MKNKTFLTLSLTVLMIFCTSCSGLIAKTPLGSAAVSKDRSNMGVGILMMEGTTYEVNAEQAKALLPLWKAIKNLSDDDSVPEAEMAAVYRQIQETLTTEQLQQIQSVTLTATDMSTLMDKYEVQIGSAAGSGKTAAAGESQSQGNPGGGMPVGGGPGGDMLGGMGDPGMGGVPQSQGNAPAMAQGNEASDMNVILADAVITVLEKRQEA